MGELDDRSDLQSRWRMHLHLLICLHCRRYLASYRTTIRAAKAAYQVRAGTETIEEIPDDQIESILKAVRSE
jgi:hypothetical protein